MPYNRKAFSDDYATETFYFPLVIIPQVFTIDGTEVTADDASNYFGGAIVKISINPTVTFKVVNGS